MEIDNTVPQSREIPNSKAKVSHKENKESCVVLWTNQIRDDKSDIQHKYLQNNIKNMRTSLIWDPIKESGLLLEACSNLLRQKKKKKNNYSSLRKYWKCFFFS